MAIAEIAKLLAGAFAWDMILHLGLLASRSEPKWLGIKWTTSMNKAAAVVTAIGFIVLVYIGWFSGLQ
ncbi:MAG TPA: hypothetical protein VJ110_01700 [Candidatus Nanoarchaeia archaeon]|nr:hypothetical protein [Candidatus Nanoarchaeia archaeon]